MTLSDLPLVSHGVSTCAGCGLELLIRVTLEVLGKNTIMVNPPGCVALFPGLGDATALRIPGFQGNLENTAAYAAGIRAGLDLQGRQETTVLALAGDGATVDIGLQSLSGMFERGDRVLYLCYDNEAYMNTGIQSSGSTPYRAATTTTPSGKTTPRKDMLAIAAAHGIPYTASASIAYLKDLKKKIEKARQAAGPAYLHVHTPCPTGWAFEPSRLIEVAKLAVQTGAWPLIEIEAGYKRQTVRPPRRRPVKDYLQLQGRFNHLSEADIDEIQQQVDAAAHRLEIETSVPEEPTHGR